MYSQFGAGQARKEAAGLVTLHGGEYKLQTGRGKPLFRLRGLWGAQIFGVREAYWGLMLVRDKEETGRIWKESL